MDTYQVIVFENLAPMEVGKGRGMRKSIMDVAWEPSQLLCAVYLCGEKD